MKVCPVGGKLFHVDRQIDRRTDMSKLIIPFHNFANVPKKWKRNSGCGMYLKVGTWKADMKME